MPFHSPLTDEMPVVWHQCTASNVFNAVLAANDRRPSVPRKCNHCSIAVRLLSAWRHFCRRRFWDRPRCRVRRSQRADYRSVGDDGCDHDLSTDEQANSKAMTLIFWTFRHLHCDRLQSSNLSSRLCSAVLAVGITAVTRHHSPIFGLNLS